MPLKKRSEKYIKFVIYLIVVVLVNIAGTTLFFRLDLSANKMYSISDASKKVVSTLSEPLTIKVFFTKNLPAPHNNTERYLHDLLEEYAIHANRYFNYSFHDVSAEEGELSEESQENQKLANNYGIHPVQIQAIEKDEVKFQRAYMGLVVIHGDLIERIPTIATTEGLEYNLTTAIQKLNNKISALLRLQNNIQIKLFLSSSLNQIAPYIGLKQLAQFPDALGKMVAELNQKNYNKLDFKFFDPTIDAGLAAAVKQYNIMTVKWPALDNGKILPGDGAIGMIMEYGGRTAMVPLLQVIKIPIIGTQYKLTAISEVEEHITRNLETLIDINQDLGFVAGNGTLDIGGTSSMGPNFRQNPDAVLNFRTLISKNYSLKPVNVETESIPEDLHSIVIARPTEPFSDYGLFQIDQFLMKGKNLILFLDRFREVQPGSQQARSLGGQQSVFVPLDTGLEKLLNHYGVRIKQSYVLDENCFHQELPAQLGGGERAIYYAPIIKNRFINKELSFMKNIKGMITLKISPLALDTERLKANNIEATRLISSSEKSWEMSGRITLNPMFIQPPASKEDMQSKALAYFLTGEFPSYFADKPIPEKKMDETEAKTSGAQTDAQQKDSQTSVTASAIDLSKITASGQFLAKGNPGKIFLMASSDMLRDNLLDAGGRGPNATYILNVIDYLNGREDIAMMRGKQQRFNPLDDAAASTRTFVKTMNIVGLPALVVLFGIAVWYRRHARKKNIQMMFQRSGVQGSKVQD
ncbi:MAG: Gldg family protein [Desulfobacterales bacterium]|nr:Gldg family protein [Desulfobacterales bacterium]